MSNLLLQADIEAEFNVSRAAVRKAQRRGKLPAVALGSSPSGRVRWGYRRSDVVKWRRSLDSKRAGRTKRPWGWDEIEAALELRSSCTAAQVGEYLNRPERGVFHIWNRYSEEPITMRRIPFHIPSTGILLAKTCTTCGKVRDASYYRRRPDSKSLKPTYTCRCAICERAAKQGYKCDTERSRNIELLQEITSEQAWNENRKYSPGEWDVLKDKDINEVEAAFKLNRSYLAVVAQRTKLGMYGSLPRLKLDDSHWEITFPNALKALQQHFVAIGKPVPEQIWDWNNTMEGTKK